MAWGRLLFTDTCEIIITQNRPQEFSKRKQAVQRDRPLLKTHHKTISSIGTFYGEHRRMSEQNTSVS
jgi:hypothetical protein